MSTSLTFPGAPSGAGAERTENARDALSTPDALDAALREAWGALDRAHPTWALPCEVFLAAVRPRVVGAGLDHQGAVERLERLVLDDLFLVTAALNQSRHAVSAFFERYERYMLGCLRQMGLRPVVVDDLMLDLRATLFSPRGPKSAPARLALYGGGGSLKAWLRITIKRLVFDHARRSKAEPGGEHLPERAAGEPGPEDDLASRDLLARLRICLQAALDGLGAGERALLLKYERDGLCLREIAAEDGVVASTVQRRLQSIRAQVARAMISDAFTRFGIDETTIRDSIEALAETIALDDLLIALPWLLGALGRRG